MHLTLTDASGKALNATVEVEGDTIVVHSRSGKDRNRDDQERELKLCGVGAAHSRGVSG